jgi:hypothetical protein
MYTIHLARSGSGLLVVLWAVSFTVQPGNSLPINILLLNPRYTELNLRIAW